MDNSYGSNFNYGQSPLYKDEGVRLHKPQVGLSISSDGGRTFSPEQCRNIGEKGNYLFHTTWNRLGSAFDRVFRVVCAEDAPIIFIDAFVDTDLQEEKS